MGTNTLKRALAIFVAAAMLLALLPTGIISVSATTADIAASSSGMELINFVRSDNVLINGFDSLTENDFGEVNGSGPSFDTATIDNRVFAKRSIRVIGGAFDGDPSYGWSSVVIKNVFGAENLNESDGLRFWIKYNASYNPAPDRMIIRVGNSEDGVLFETDSSDVLLPDSEGYVCAFWKRFYCYSDEISIFDYLNKLDYICIMIECCYNDKSYYVSDLHAAEWEGDMPCGSCGENLTWSLDDEGTLFVNGKGEMTSAPWSKLGFIYNSINRVIIGDGVTNIDGNAFSKCYGLASVTIPDSVTSIGSGAFFGCTGLTSITIPDSVTNIGDYAFYGCTGLTSVTIPDSVTSIGLGAFYNTGYYNNESNWKNDVLYIGNCLIKAKNSISGSYVIKSGTVCIGEAAFYRCTGLTSVTIPNSVTSIVYEAFEGCTGLTSVTIPDSVTSIGGDAFEGCTGLTSVTIPDSVTSIGSFAFYRCTGLTSVTIPDSVTSIGSYAFGYCTGLVSINVDTGNTAYHSAGNCLIETESKTLIAGCKNSVIPADGSVTSIGDGAFGGCTGLTSVTIPDSVMSIVADAFSNTGYYNNEANWENGLLYIGNWIINTKSNISGAKTIKSGTVGIAACAFRHCTGLTSVTIPDSVTHIGSSAFDGCTGLGSITVASGNPVYHSEGNCLIETDSKTLIAGCKNSVVPSDGSVTCITKYAFSCCAPLTSVTIPHNVTSIDDCAFYRYSDNRLNLTLHVYNNSYAYQYAVSNNFSYEFIKPSRIAVTVLPDKISYLEAKDTLDATGGVITAYYDNGTTEEITMTADMISGFDNTAVGPQTLTVTYEGQTATFDVEIIAKTLTGMRVTTLPTNRRYIEYNGGLNLYGGKYTLYYDNDTTETFNLTAGMVSGFDITSIGVQTLTVTYGGFTDTFDVEVVAKSISSISVTRLPDKTSYLEAKETLDVTGGIITVYYDNGTSETIDLSAEMVVGFNNRVPGDNVLTVYYQGKRTTFSVTIVAKTLVKIVATRLPDKTVYKEGEEFDPTGLEVTAYYDNDTTEIIEDYGIFGYYSTPGERAVTVTYGGKYYSFGVVVVANNMKGDPDGDGVITVSDALAALRIAAKLAEPTPELIACCDTDGDGVIAVNDALAILRVAAKLADSL